MEIVNPGDSGTNVILHRSAWANTRDQGVYVLPTTGNGIEVAAVTPSAITPSKAGNWIEIEFTLMGESLVNSIFNVSRNGVLLPNSSDGTDASNNRWSGITLFSYDTDHGTTPGGVVIRIIDEDSLAVASTYRLLGRTSGASTGSMSANRSVNSAGATDNETGYSTCKLTEYVT
jgi:hypothetical protein